MSCTEEERIQWFKDTFGSSIGKIILSGDRVEEFIVVDDLYDAVSQALENMDLPMDFPDQQNVTRDQLERDFKAYCKQIIVRSASTDQLAVADENISPEMQFIRPVTSRMKINGAIEQWDRSIGFTESLKGMGMPFEYSAEEKKLIFGFAHLLNCLSQQAARVQTANPNMFKMD